MKNVIIPFSLSSVQERDHLVWDKVAQKPMILKRDTYKASEYDTARFSAPHSQIMGLYHGKVLSAPLAMNGTAMWAQSSFYKITGLSYPCTLNIEFYKTSDASTSKITTSVTGNDATSLAAAIKAIDSFVVKAEVLSDGIGVQCNSYNTSDMSNAIYSSMRFRIIDDDAVKVDSQTVEIGDVTLHMMDEFVYQCQSMKDILKLRGIAVPPHQAYPGSATGAGTSGPLFHLKKGVSYYTTNGKATFDKSNTMTKAMFDSLAESTNAEQKAYWELYNGDYETYVARSFMDIDNVLSSNTIFEDIAEMTKIMGSIKTQDYNGNTIDAYPAVGKSLTYGFDDPIHAVGNWLGQDWRLMSIYMRKVGLNSTNKTDWDKEIQLVGGTPTYAASTMWLSCCEHNAYNGVIFGATSGNWSTNHKNYSHSLLPFLASNF